MWAVWPLIQRMWEGDLRCCSREETCWASGWGEIEWVGWWSGRPVIAWLSRIKTVGVLGQAFIGPVRSPISSARNIDWSPGSVLQYFVTFCDRGAMWVVVNPACPSWSEPSDMMISNWICCQALVHWGRMISVEFQSSKVTYSMSAGNCRLIGWIFSHGVPLCRASFRLGGKGWGRVGEPMISNCSRTVLIRAARVLPGVAVAEEKPPLVVSWER